MQKKTMSLGIRGALMGFLAPVALALSCGGGGGGQMTQAEFCAEKATKECDGVTVACLSDPAKCKTQRVAACEEFAAAQQAAPSSALLRPFRPDKAAACISKAAEVYKKSPITPADRAALDEVCARVFSGTRKSSDADPSCHNDYECDPSEICDQGFKQCAKKVTVAANAGCNNPGEVCPASQFCAATAPRKCTAKLTANMACDETNPCVDTLRCADGVCLERKDRGDACTSNNDCSADFPYCDSYNGSICTPGFTPATGGKECVAAFGGEDTANSGS